MDIQKHSSVMKDCDEGKTIHGHNGPERFVYALSDIGSIIEHQELAYLMCPLKDSPVCLVYGILVRPRTLQTL